MHRYLFITLVFFIAGRQGFSYSTVDYSQVKEKIEKNFSLVDRLKVTYPVFNDNRDIIEKLRRKWNEQKSDYRRATAREKNRIFKEILSTHLKIENLLRDLAVSMQRYSEDILLDFNDRLNEERNSSIKPESYTQRMQVGKQEFSRAASAFRKKQYAYSIHLYDRGISIVSHTYKKLNWALPPTYRAAAR